MYVLSDSDNHLYSNVMATQTHYVAEAKYPYLHWTERHLQVMWWEQKYFKKLTSNDNLPIEILSPGIWNPEAGPDFLKAHIKIGNQEVRGDIEIHLDEDSWTHHKHHIDKRYDKVILHVSLWLPKKRKEIISSAGNKIPQAHLYPFLTIPETRILQLIDLDKYPHRKFLSSSQCLENINKTSEEKIFDLFGSAAEWRLTQKAHYLKGHIEDTRLLLPAGIAMALGYKRNSEAFFELFLRLLKHKDKTENDLFSIGLGMCGFFSEKYREKWKHSPLYKQLLLLYKNFSHLIPHSIPLVLNQIRPINHPIRRMVYLIKLIKDPLMTSLYAEIYLCWDRYWPDSYLKKDWLSLRQMISERLPTYYDEYWNYHYHFEKDPQADPLALFGKDLADITIINTILPLLYIEVIKKNNPSEIQAFRDFYRSLPANYNSKTRYSSHCFFSDQPQGQILQKAVAQQGAFQLYKEFCLHYEASNDSCTYVEKNKKMIDDKKALMKDD